MEVRGSKVQATWATCGRMPRSPSTLLPSTSLDHRGDRSGGNYCKSIFGNIQPDYPKLPDEQHLACPFVSHPITKHENSVGAIRAAGAENQRQRCQRGKNGARY